MAGTARAAGDLARTLDPSVPAALDRALLSGRTVDEILVALVEAVRPADGTLDGEASRESVRDALSDVLGRYETADLLDLTTEQREFVVERFTSHDVYRRFVLDVGKHMVDKAPSKTAALARLGQARDYIREVIGESFRALRDAGQVLSVDRIQETVRRALSDSFQVFEEYR